MNTPTTRAGRIEALLALAPDQRFTPTQVAQTLGITTHQAAMTLRQLMKRGRIKRDKVRPGAGGSTYWYESSSTHTHAREDNT